MSDACGLNRRGRVLAGVVALLMSGVPAGVATAANRSAPALSAESVSMTVDDVSPNTPIASHHKQKLAIVITLHNNAATTLRVQISGERGDPIGSQTALDAAIAKPKAPSPDLVAPIPNKQGAVTLLPASDVDVVFRTTTDIPKDAGICLCHDAIYPLYFTATTTGANATLVGTTQTYLPVFGKTTPKPVLVSWLWPLLDQPHRLTSPATGRQVFLDDDLASEVTTGGRLDKLLSVVELLRGRVPMTLVLDPELIDELAVMSTGRYVVQSPTGTGTVPGTGSEAASIWLERLDLAVHQSGMEVDFTPFADPAVDSLTANNLSWRTDLLGSAGRKRVNAALGGKVVAHDIAWPAGETLSAETLGELVRHGARTVVVDSATMRAPAQPSKANALSAVRTSSGPALTAVTSAGIQRYARRVLQPGGPGLGELPQLVSEVAIRAVQTLDESHQVVITPPRYLDPQPDIAARAILRTAYTSWSRPLALRAATRTVTAVDRGAVHKQDNAPALPRTTLDSIDYVKRSLPGIRSMLSRADSAALLDPLPAAVQRTAATAWVSDPARSIATSTALARQVRTLLDGVSLVDPATRNYTLTSSNSSLPVTIRNTLAVDVHVRVNVTAANGLPGFTADQEQVQTIAAGNTKQVKIPTHIVRAGRIEVNVALTAPQGTPLGQPLTLTVRSTVLGTVGVVITTTAGVVLALALLLRGVAYLRRRNRPTIAVRGPDDVGP